MTADVRGSPPGSVGTWTYDGKLTVCIRWEVGPCGTTARVTVHEGIAGGVGDSVTLRLEASGEEAAVIALRPDARVRIWLEREHGVVSLRAQVPLEGRRSFTSTVAFWPASSGFPTPPAPPDPAPAPPPRPPIPPDRGRPLGTVPVWGRLPPPSPHMTLDMLRWVQLADPGALPLYVALAAAGTDPAAQPNKIQLATKFRDGEGFVHDPSTLPTPVDRLGELRADLLALPGEATTDLLARRVHAALGVTVADFLTSDAWRTSAPALWQSVMALALAGDAGASGDGLVDALRTANFIAALADGAPRFESPHWRRTALHAIVVLPDACALWSPSLTTAAAQTPAGWCVVGGAGMFGYLVPTEIGYEPGPIAEVVSVLPGERRSRGERAVQDTAVDERREATREATSARARGTTERVDVTRVLRERLAADVASWNLSGLKPSYADLQLILNGTWAGGGVGGERAWEDIAHFVRSLAEEATARLAESTVAVRRERSRQHVERRSDSVIDNSAGSAPIQGVYRWLDRVVALASQPVGPRLLLAFVVDKPGAGWLDKLASAPPVPLRPPPTPPCLTPPPAVEGWTLITPDAYLAWGANLGLSDLPPPPATPSPTVCIGEGTPGGTDVVEIPEGFAATAVSVQLAASDGTCDVVCLVAGTAYTLQGTGTFDLATGTPTSTSASASLTPPGTAASPPLVSSPAGAGTFSPPLTGRILVSVVTRAPRFRAVLVFTCAPVSAAPTSAYVAWQVQTWQRLQAAWTAQREAWHRALGERIVAATRGRPDELQREVLREACVGILAAGVAGATAPGPTTPWLGGLDAAVAWNDASWTLTPWPAGSAAPDAWGDRETALREGHAIHPFVAAGSAHVLVPVRPADTLRIASYFAFARSWSGTSEHAPVTAGFVATLSMLLSGEKCPPMPAPELPPIIRVPTSLVELEAAGGHRREG